VTGFARTADELRPDSLESNDDALTELAESASVLVGARILLSRTAEFDMNNLVLTLPTFGFVVATRAALGVGIGLLLSERLPSECRRALGLTLVGLGAATTIPAVMAVLQGTNAPRELNKFSDPSWVEGIAVSPDETLKKRKLKEFLAG